jgi:hypothetical protein
MSNLRNRFGLSRHIPEDVKAEVRRKSKQGCVICRALGYDYEHIEPEFADAKKHDPEHICLLCGSHHDEVTRGRLSKEQVRRAYDGVQRSSKVRPPLYRAQLTDSLKLGLGDSLFDYMPPDAAVLRYDGKDVLKVGYVADEVFGGSRPSISGIVCSENGNKLVRFVDNELSIIDARGDVKFRKDKLSIYDEKRKLVLQITFSPPDGIRIDRLRFRYGEVVCEMDQTFGLTMPIGGMPVLGGQRVQFLVGGITASGAQAAIDYTSDRTKWHPGDNLFGMVGGEGIWIGKTGATLAYKAGSMLVRSVKAVPRPQPPQS